MDELLERLQSSLKKADVEFAGKKLLLFVSGGRDSVAMLEMIRRLYGATNQISAVTIHYGLRGRESDGDAQYVETLCQEKKIKLTTHRVVYEKGNIQAWARSVRISLIKEALKKKEADYCLLAHQADDLLETFFLKMFKSASPWSWLMKVKKGAVIRPLLALSRDEITVWLEKNKLSYRDDSSNQLATYERNFLRLEILPSIKKKFGSKWQTRSLSHFSQVVETANLHLSFKKYFLLKGNAAFFKSAFYQLDKEWALFYLQHLLTRLMAHTRVSYGQQEKLRQKLASKKSGKVWTVKNENWRIDGNAFFKDRVTENIEILLSTEKPIAQTQQARWELKRLEELPVPFVFSPNRFLFYSEVAEFSIIIRKRRVGETFTVHPKNETVHIKDWLITRHIPQHLRREQVVVEYQRAGQSPEIFGLWVRRHQRLQFFQKAAGFSPGPNQWHSAKALEVSIYRYQIEVVSTMKKTVEVEFCPIL